MEATLLFSIRFGFSSQLSKDSFTIQYLDLHLSKKNRGIVQLAGPKSFSNEPSRMDFSSSSRVLA